MYLVKAVFLYLNVAGIFSAYDITLSCAAQYITETFKQRSKTQEENMLL